LALRPILANSLNDVAFEIVETAIKLVIWTVPAVLLVRYYKTDVWINLKEMTTNKVKWLRYALILLGFILYSFLGAWFSFGKVAIHPNFRPVPLISMVLFAGITEESVLRGWLLNATLKKMKPWYAVLLNAVLFLLVHFPIWIYYDVFSNMWTLLSNCAGVVILSIIFSWTFIKSRNIFVPIILHSSWNLLMTLFFGI
jgi:membrane protease YdiL (CAAX protease family)